jgi:hypothetical protein
MDDEARYFPFFQKRIGGESKGRDGYRDGSFEIDPETLRMLYPDFVPSRSGYLGDIAAGRSGFSTPYADKQNQIDKYLENIRRLREKGILPTPKAQYDFSSGDVMFAGAPRYIKYGGPPNSIIRAPHIDSSVVDGYIQNYRERDLIRGPQLPGFV